MFRDEEAGKKTVSSKYFSMEQIGAICDVLTEGYFVRRESEGKPISPIDIEELAACELGCKIVYENIAREDESCVGFAANGIEALPVLRDGRIVYEVFPKDTIVIDKYLNSPSLRNKKRFTIGHELGHVIKNRMHNGKEARYNHIGNEMPATKEAAHERMSVYEVEANCFAASLLMPERKVAEIMREFYGKEKIVKYIHDILGGDDVRNVKKMADRFGVSYMAMYIRLKDLGFITEGSLDTYVEENVMSDMPYENT